MKIDIPDSVCQEALEAHFIQQGGSINSTEGRSREVERRQHHIGEIVTSILINEYKKRKLLPPLRKPN